MKKKLPHPSSGAIVIEGHVQGLSNVRSLGEIGVPVIVIDKFNCIARYSKFCSKFFYCPDFISEEFTEFLITLASKENLAGWSLFPSNDHAVYRISKDKDKLEKFYKVITPNNRTLDNIYDKTKLLEIAHRLNLPIPQTVFFNSEDDPIPGSIMFPLLTKGKNGLSFYKVLGKKVFLSESESQLRQHLATIKQKFDISKTFTQELIPSDGTNKTISFTAFSINGEIKSYWVGEKLREHPIRFGTATFARSVLCPPLLEPCRILLRELNYTGVCEAEFLLDPRDNKYKLIEINARTWLWVGLARSCGIDYAVMIYKYLNGITATYPLKYHIGVNWINYITDVPYSIIAIIKGKLSISKYFSSFKGRTTSAFFNWRDIKPSLMFFILLIYIVKKRR